METVEYISLNTCLITGIIYVSATTASDITGFSENKSPTKLLRSKFHPKGNEVNT